MKIRVHTDVARYTAALDEAGKRQVPFALARALTMTARDVQVEERADLPKRFTIRTPRVPKGIRITPATKAKPEAIVGSIDWFMKDQETGGTRRAKGHRIAVPKAVRRTKRDLVSKANRPTPVRDKPKVFLVKTAYGAGILRRQGKERYPVEVLYWLKRGVKIKPAMGFKAKSATTVERRFGPNFVQALSDAMGHRG
jgi:hypothetical protein